MLKTILTSLGDFLYLHAPMSRQKTIFVYNGEGSLKNSLQMLLRGLQSTVDSSIHNVLTITPEDIIKGSWAKDAAAICFGGGYDLGFIRALGPVGIRNIRDYVYRGGSYLGICAGAYFGCEHIYFDEGGNLEVCGERDLKFFPGFCRGPVYPGFQYNSEVGAKAAPIKVLPENCLYPELKIPIYFNGGGFFDFLPPDKVCSNPSAQAKILACYDDVEDQPIAIIKTKFGLGQTLLTGVHVEFDPHMLDESDFTLSTFVEELKNHNDKRIQLFKKLLQHINLVTKS